MTIVCCLSRDVVYVAGENRRRFQAHYVSFSSLLNVRVTDWSENETFKDVTKNKKKFFLCSTSDNFVKQLNKLTLVSLAC